MPLYEVEVIHEATGEYMSFTYESDAPDEQSLSSDILSDLSVVVFKVDTDE